MRRRLVFGAVAILVVGLLGFTFFFVRALTARGGATGRAYVRFERPTPRLAALREAERRGFLYSARAVDLFARLTGRPETIAPGTYRLVGVYGGPGNLNGLYHPIQQRILLPATFWAKRNAKRLQGKEVCAAADYMAEVAHPEGRDAGFPLPTGTLEGYLYPGRYDLPPLLGAKAVVGMQLRAFKEKVWEPLGHPADLPRILTIASLVELEAGRDDERPLIAGVIENRLKKRMRLQIDASILYGLGKWRRLTFKDYRTDSSPYNLYLHGGLPPTPICSPSIASIRAAMNPAKHNDLYYVALPDGHSLFAPTYEEHKRNIEKRKEALRGG